MNKSEEEASMKTVEKENIDFSATIKRGDPLVQTELIPAEKTASDLVAPSPHKSSIEESQDTKLEAPTA